MKRKVLSVLLLCAMTASLIVGCGGSGSEDSSGGKEDAQGTEEQGGSGEKKDTFTYAVADDPGNIINFITTDDRVGLMVCKLVSEPLFSVAPDGSYIYYVAESFEPSEDGLTYTAKLKSDIKWSDGEPITADDVIFSYEKYMESEKADNLAVDGTPIQINKVDDATVEFVLPSVVGSMPENISGVTLYPKHIFEGKDSLDMDMNEGGIVGCGPYIFETYKSGEYISFTKNPNYVNEEAKTDKVVLQIITNDETAKAALQNGEVDAWIAMPASMDGLEDFTVNTYSEGRVAYLRLNRIADSMQNADFRKGILYALNREDIMTAAYTSMDYATLSYSFLPPTNGFYTENVEKYDQDLDKARELLANGTTNKLKICYIGTDPGQSAQAQVIQAELKEVGIEVELCGVEQAAYVNSAYDNGDKTYDMYLGGYIMTNDPDGFAGLFVRDLTNMINFDSDKVEELFAAGKVETDPDKRAEIYNELQAAVADEALFYPFGSNLRILVTNPSLKGIDEARLVPIFTFEDMSKLYFE